jgi:H+-translocating NAD(P) transhydrogenase subunit alpha
MTTIFVPREVAPGETRVAATPETVRRYVKAGYTVVVEEGAGVASACPDAEFVAAGATVRPSSKEAWLEGDIVLKVQPPMPHEGLGAHEADLPKAGALLIGFVWSVQSPELAKRLNDRKVSAIAMEAIPRISRAQKHDALSSQANLAGYKAVLMGADALPRIMPMLVTAAGTIKPAKVVVMGAGVAGLQAIATAKRLGAVVEATDVRPAVKEQIESLGAKFIDVPDLKAEGEGGYAKELTKEQLAKQQQVVAERLVLADMIITTALIPGKRAPILVPADVVKRMRPGSVIVDLAVQQGGNCELAVPGQTVVREGVKIIGVLNVPALMPVDASAVYARNLLAVVQDITDKKVPGKIALDLKDEVVDKSLIIHEGEVRHGPTKDAVAKLGQPAGVAS